MRAHRAEASASFPSGAEREDWCAAERLDCAREVEDEVVRMGDDQSVFVPWDNRCVERREQPVTKNAAWS